MSLLVVLSVLSAGQVSLSCDAKNLFRVTSFCGKRR
jgi:hypothetical protein